jgi:acyl carrier protein
MEESPEPLHRPDLRENNDIPVNQHSFNSSVTQTLEPETKSKITQTIEKSITPEPENHTFDAEIEPILFEIISRLTGFPVEMLEPSMNLESDLGIDSIKRVEILSKLEQELDHVDTISSDDIGTLKTIEEIIVYLTKNDSEPSVESKKKHQSLKLNLKKKTILPAWIKN